MCSLWGSVHCSLKIGYGILSSELSEYFTRITPPFRAPTVCSYLAGVALEDQGFVIYSRQSVRVEKERLLRGLEQRGYLIGKTYEYSPIFLAGFKDSDIDLRQNFLYKGILTLPGTSFKYLGKSYVRINCPVSAEEFLKRLK